ncbi:glycosyltransferase family 2 protein [Cytophaga aurantiaca]|uniref:glycosyltransferase family 2 protein n=1 Tax=Cytophaga aurantiaca TaxID=29530 RepID=UPI00052492FB|nr:glycosyltransferase family 2 protein [Cytophaga aurantiaca]
MPVIQKISVVAPVYNEEKNIPELCKQLHQVLSNLPYEFEIILINDGSADLSHQKIYEMALLYPEVKGIDLAGNYGQTLALRAGFESAKGDVIIAMDSDLQHDPKDIARFMQKIEEGYDLVGGAKETRPDGWFKSKLSSLAHKVISKLAQVDMSYFGATYKAYRSYLLTQTNLLGDSHRFMGAIVARKGIRYTEIPITIHERAHGTSNYKMNKVWKVLLDLIFLKFFISYLNKPFRLFGSIGFLFSFVGLAGVVSISIGNFFFSLNVKEEYLVEFFSSAFLIVMGLLFLSIGVLAEIGVYNYYGQKRKSPYTIRTIIKKPNHAKETHS